VVHTLRFCSKFPDGILGKSACWGVSPIPTEHTINCVATPPAEADKITGQITSVPVIFLFHDEQYPFLKDGQYLPLQ
jgi:hypothetical protein